MTQLLGEKTIRLAVFRDLKSERFVSMERYASALVDLADGMGGISAADYVLDEGNVSNVTSAIDKLRRYRRRYIDYPRYASSIAADVYHIADHSSAHLLRALPPHRAVVTCHDVMLLTQDDWATRRYRSPAVPLLRYSVSYLKRAARVVADSTKTRDDLLHLGLAASEKIDVIPPPVDAIFSPCWKEDRQETRRRLGLASDHVVVLHVGTASAYKNVEAVVDVITTLRHRGVPAVLLRVGRVLDRELRERIIKAGLSEWVLEAGFAEDEALARYYGCADVLLYPSFKEGFGWPVIEALASGLPVVASRADSISEILAGTGIQCDATNIDCLAEGVLRATLDSMTRARLVELGLKRAQDYSMTAVAESLMSLYTDVVSEAETIERRRHQSPQQNGVHK